MKVIRRSSAVKSQETLDKLRQVVLIRLEAGFTGTISPEIHCNEGGITKIDFHEKYTLR